MPSPLHILKKETSLGKGLVFSTSKSPLVLPKGKVLDFLKDPQYTFFLDGKELIIDRYTPVTFEIHLKETAPDEWEGEFFSLFSKKKVSLNELTWFLSYPPVICYNSILYLKCPDILLQEGKISPDEIEQEEGVTLHLTPLNARPISCTPLLHLTDRTGGFANLSFEGKKDALAEKGWENDLLETDFQKKIVGSSHYYCPLNKVYTSLSFLLELGWTILDVEGKRLHRLVDTHFELSDTLHLKGRLKFDEYERPIEEVMGTFNRKERFLNLAPGHVGLLPPLEAVEWGDLLEEEPRVVEGGLQFKPFQMGLFKDIPFTKPIKKELAPSDSFKGELRPYQKTGVEFLQNLYQQGFSALLADEMGLGKTVQVLAFLASVPRTKPCLIVVPTSLLFNWESEIGRFLPDLKLSVYHGPNRALEQSDLVLTTYGTVREDAHILAKTAFEVIVLDEAHLMKNAETLTAKSLFGLNGQFKLSMSGTPVENHLNELFSHFRFLIPGLLNETDTQKRIQKKISPFFLRRKKKEVALDLPPLTEQTVFIDMPPAQRALYDKFLQQHRSIILEKLTTEGVKKGRLEIFEVLLRLRQLALHPSLFPGETDTSSGKMEVLMEDIESIVEGKEKALIYSQFTSFLSLIKKELDERNIPYTYLDGTTQDRKGAVDRFQNDPEVPLFLMSLKAGGVGLNLTEADYVLLLDPWWNQAAEEQAIGRSHRIGRTKPVIAKRYISRETIEEKMVKIKKMKKELAEGLFDEEGSILDAAFIEELLS